MPAGKPAGVRCIHLDDHHYCKLFNSPQRPAVCMRFQASQDACGENFVDAMQQLQTLERLTANS
jgi:hypothetical protein